MEIHIPYNFKYREYQKPLREYIKSGGKRASCRWHRRAGKDQTCFNILVEESIKEKGGYAYIFPTYAQGKKVIWDSVDKSGKKFRDFIPKQLITGENGTELKISLINGSFIQILGSDNIDSLRGTAYRGVVFSEYAFHNPIVWEVIRPVLAENGGFAIFNSTPNGKNHFYELDNNFKDNINYFHQVLTVDDTGVITQDQIQEERDNGMSEQMIQQEYYCSFEVGAIGSYYIDLINNAKQEQRITQLPLYRERPVDIYTDIGSNHDYFTFWFKQDDGQFFNFINYFQDTGKQLDYYYGIIDDFLSNKGLKLGKIFLPHDGKQKGHSFLVSGVTIYDEFVSKYGEEHIGFIPNTVSVNDRIKQTRAILPKCRFDSNSCKYGILCLEEYKKDYDEIKKVFKDDPRHNWASHGSDAFGYFSLSPNTYYMEKTEFNYKISTTRSL